jgi:hypothetical protein
MSTNTLDALGSRLAAARGLIAEALQDSRSAIAEHGTRGLHGARERSLEAWHGAQRGGRAAGRAMSDHPWETLVLAGVAGIAIGWIVRHAWRGQPARATTAKPRQPRARTTRPNRKR